ncbi:hypothetical protein GEST5281_13670 [Geobacillus stearothermophilus]
MMNAIAGRMNRQNNASLASSENIATNTPMTNKPFCTKAARTLMNMSLIASVSFVTRETMLPPGVRSK